MNNQEYIATQRFTKSSFASPNRLNFLDLLLNYNQLENAFGRGQYYVLQSISGYRFAVNSKIMQLAIQRSIIDKNVSTDIISYRVCGLQEYITKKIPIINKESLCKKKLDTQALPRF